MTGRPRALALSWLLATVPALVALRRLGVSTPVIAWFVVVMVVLTSLLRWAPRWWVLATAIAGFQLVVRAGAPGEHWWWMVASVAAWAVALGGFTPSIGGRDASPDAARTMAVPLAGAAVSMVAAAPLLLPATLAVASGLIWVAVVVGPEAVGRAADDAGRWVGRAPQLAAGLVQLLRRVVGVVLMVPVRVVGAALAVPVYVALFTVWAGQRLVGFDPLRSRGGRGAGWLDRHVERDSARLGGGWVPMRPPGQRAHRLLAGVAMLAIWALVGLVGVSIYAVVSATSADGSALPECPVSCEVFGHSQQWQQLWEDTDRFTAHPRYDASTGFRFDDITSTYINVAGGQRAGWTPPPCGCRRVRVWWYGGSTGFGFWQRDDQSLPSQVARAAARRGVTLDVHNFAMPGWVIGQEVRDFGNRLVRTPAAERPDVVVFFDGANDIVAQEGRNRDGRGTDESEPMINESVLDVVVRTGRLPDDDDRAEPAPGSRRLATDDMVEHAVHRYSRNTELATLVATSAGVTPIFVWQPVAAFSPVEASGEPALGGRSQWRSEMGAASKLLPHGVVDLTRALTDVRTPVWGDALHTNEQGAAIVAERLLDRVIDQLRARPEA